MSKKLKYTSSKSQPIENSSNFVELEPELFLNSKEFYKIIQTNYKKNNNQDIIFTPKSKSDKNNSSKSKDIDNQKIKVNIPLSTKNLTNIKLNFNDNIENKENKFRSNNILNINSQFKKETNKINNKNEKNLNINDFNYKSNNKIIKLEKKNSNKSNKNEKKEDKKFFTIKKEKSYYSFSEISSLDLNKTSSDINTNNSIEY
jgi:hypothetical protein